MDFIEKDQWEKLIKIPVKHLNNVLQEAVKLHGSVICAYVEGKQIEYFDGFKWQAIKLPSFDPAVKYRIYRPMMKFSVDLQQDEAEAIKRVFEGKGLNAEERRVVTALSEEFNKQFGSAFSKGA